jgi:hypothetical protein
MSSFDLVFFFKKEDLFFFEKKKKLFSIAVDEALTLERVVGFS